MTESNNSFYQKIKHYYSLDFKSLSLFRIILALIFIWDISSRFCDIGVFYSDSGILSRSELLQNFSLEPRIGFLLINGSDFFVTIFFILAIISGLFFLVGFRTKLAAFFCYFAYLSIHQRFPAITHGGDGVVRLFFLYSCFLPVNAYYSVDRALLNLKNNQKNIIENNPPFYYGAFSYLIYLQLFCIYFFTFYYKWHPDWHTNFSAVYYTLHLEMYNGKLAALISNQIFLSKLMTLATMIIEGIAPILLLIPFFKNIPKMMAIILLTSLHFGIWVLFYLGTFPPACIAIWLLLLPSQFWTFLSEKLKKIYSNQNFQQKEIIIFYDEKCYFCLRMVYIVKEFLLLNFLNISHRPSSLDSRAHDLMLSQNSWVLKVDDQYFIRFSAFLKLLENSYFSPLTYLLDSKLIISIGDFFYKKISQNRMKLNQPFNFIRTSNINFKPNFSSNIIGSILAALILAWNIEGTWYFKNFDIKSPFTDVVLSVQLNQQWNMFAPTPMKDNGYFIFEGLKNNGETWDVFYNTSVSFSEKPENIYSRFINSQWRKFLVNIWFLENKKYRPFLAKWICHKWNNRHQQNQKINSLKIYFMLDRIQLIESADKDKSTIRPQSFEKKLVLDYQC